MAKTTSKLTKRDYFNILREAYPQTADNYDAVIGFIDHELELLSKKNAADKKPTATQVANDGFKTSIKAVMSAEPTRLFTITELIKTVPEITDLTNQRVSAIVRQMVTDGTLDRVEEKRKAYFRIHQ